MSCGRIMDFEMCGVVGDFQLECAGGLGSF